MQNLVCMVLFGSIQAALSWLPVEGPEESARGQQWQPTILSANISTRSINIIKNLSYNKQEFHEPLLSTLRSVQGIRYFAIILVQALTKVVDNVVTEILDTGIQVFQCSSDLGEIIRDTAFSEITRSCGMLAGT